MGTRDQVIKRYLKNQSERGDGDCTVLMRSGKWLVPASQRPALAPPPQEMSVEQRKVWNSINPVNGLRM